MAPRTGLTCLAIALSLAAALAGPAGAASQREVKQIVAAEAKDTAVPPSLALAVADVESGFRDDRESPEGARGVMQITPEVARAHGVDAEALWDARANIRLGLALLGTLFRQAEHQWPAALERYAAAIPGGHDGPDFARRVLRLERRFAEEIVTRSEIEKRKREILNIAGATRAEASVAWLAPAPEAASPPAPAATDIVGPVPSAQLAFHQPAADRDDDLQARLAAARRSLDDFAAGRIPPDLMQPRGQTQRRGRSWR